MFIRVYCASGRRGKLKPPQALEKTDCVQGHFTEADGDLQATDKLWLGPANIRQDTHQANWVRTQRNGTAL